MEGFQDIRSNGEMYGMGGKTLSELLYESMLLEQGDIGDQSMVSWQQPSSSGYGNPHASNTLGNFAVGPAENNQKSLGYPLDNATDYVYGTHQNFDHPEYSHNPNMPMYSNNGMPPVYPGYRNSSTNKQPQQGRPWYTKENSRTKSTAIRSTQGIQKKERAKKGKRKINNVQGQISPDIANSFNNTNSNDRLQLLNMYDNPNKFSVNFNNHMIHINKVGSTNNAQKSTPLRNDNLTKSHLWHALSSGRYNSPLGMSNGSPTSPSVNNGPSNSSEILTLQSERNSTLISNSSDNLVKNEIYSSVTLTKDPSISRESLTPLSSDTRDSTLTPLSSSSSSGLSSIEILEKCKSDSDRPLEHCDSNSLDPMRGPQEVLKDLQQLCQKRLSETEASNTDWVFIPNNNLYDKMSPNITEQHTKSKAMLDHGSLRHREGNDYSKSLIKREKASVSDMDKNSADMGSDILDISMSVRKSKEIGKSKMFRSLAVPSIDNDLLDISLSVKRKRTVSEVSITRASQSADEDDYASNNTFREVRECSVMVDKLDDTLLKGGTVKLDEFFRWCHRMRYLRRHSRRVRSFAKASPGKSNLDVETSALETPSPVVTTPHFEMPSPGVSPMNPGNDADDTEDSCSNIESPVVNSGTKSNLSQSERTENHLIRHWEPKVYQCNICEFKAFKMVDLKEHMNVHKNGACKEITFSCKFCKEDFQTKILLKHHIKHMHPNYVCKKCDFMASTECHIYQHTKKYHKVRRHQQCPLCQEVFPTLGRLVKHLVVHTTATTTTTTPTATPSTISSTTSTTTTTIMTTEITTSGNAETDDVNNKVSQNAFSCPFCDKILQSTYYYAHHVLSHQKSSPIPGGEIDQTEA